MRMQDSTQRMLASQPCSSNALFREQIFGSLIEDGPSSGLWPERFFAASPGLGPAFPPRSPLSHTGTCSCRTLALGWPTWAPWQR